MVFTQRAITVLRCIAPVVVLCASMPLLLAAEPPAPVLAEALQSGDVGELFSLVDDTALGHRSGLDEQLTASMAKARSLLVAPRIHGHRLYQRADGNWLVRLDLLPEGLNYLALKIDDPRADKPLVDWYDYALGVRLSELVSGVATLGETHAGRTFLQGLNDQPYKAWLALDGRQQQEKVAATLLLAACGAQPCYGQALEVMSAVEARNHQNPALWQLDAAVLAGDDGRFQRVLQALEQQLGDDAGLAWLQVVQIMGQNGCAGQVASVVGHVHAWPDYLPLHTAAAQCLVSAGAHAQAVQVFHRLVYDFGLQPDWNAMASDPFYQAFMASQALRAWAQQQTQ